MKSITKREINMSTKIIKSGKWTESNNALSHLKHVLQGWVDDKQLPTEVKTDLKNLTSKIDGLKCSNKNSLITLTGEILTKEKLKNIVEDSTGYKWKVLNWTKKNNPFSQELKEEVDFLVENYGIDVVEKDVSGYIFTRDSKTRDELDTLEVLCMRGHVFFNWNTGRACGHSDVLPNNMLKNYLQDT